MIPRGNTSDTPSSFNGAAARMRRRGDGSEREREVVDHAGLQRGRRTDAAEGNSDAASSAFWDTMLQRGRRTDAAEGSLAANA